MTDLAPWRDVLGVDHGELSDEQQDELTAWLKDATYDDLHRLMLALAYGRGGRRM